MFLTRIFMKVAFPLPMTKSSAYQRLNKDVLTSISRWILMLLSLYFCRLNDILSKCRSSLASLVSRRPSAVSTASTLPRIEITSASEVPPLEAGYYFITSTSRKVSTVSEDLTRFQESDIGTPQAKPRAYSLSQITAMSLITSIIIVVGKSCKLEASPPSCRQHGVSTAADRNNLGQQSFPLVRYYINFKKSFDLERRFDTDSKRI